MPNIFGTIESVREREEDRGLLITVSGIEYVTYVDSGRFDLCVGNRIEFFPYRWRTFHGSGDRWCAVVYGTHPPAKADRYIICTDSKDCRQTKTCFGSPYILFDAEREYFIERSSTKWWPVALAIRAYAYRLNR